MNLQQLRFVHETARHNFNLTHAAQAIGTSQPALSRGILELEAELGVDIFVRHGKRMLGLTYCRRECVPSYGPNNNVTH